ncbi:hypothetical protein C8R47DRAFT_942996, partial [Mycena vitilis]
MSESPKLSVTMLGAGQEVGRSCCTNFREGKGKVYMTHPTKSLHKFMMQDFVR